MNNIINASIKTLNKAKIILDSLDDHQLQNNTVPPYYSSIGCHLRHVMDFYHCIFAGIDSGQVDLTKRARNEQLEQHCTFAFDNVNSIINQLSAIPDSKSAELIEVIDDLGVGKTTIPYTTSALLAQANSHAIHHYAIINYILDRLGITIQDKSFGYNPTTPKRESAH